jgi:hypothetical protein
VRVWLATSLWMECQLMVVTIFQNLQQ